MLKSSKRFVKLLLTLTIFTSFLFSAYLENVPIDLKQPDGTMLKVFATGDEFYNWVHDKDNYTIIKDESTGYYVYALLVKGKLLPSPYVVGKVNPASVNLEKGVNVFPDIRQKLALAKKNYALSSASQTGTRYNIVIFVRFSDEVEFHQSEYSTGLLDNPQRYEDMLNNPNNFSLKHFYQVSSYGQLNVESKIFPAPSGNQIISYKDSNPRSYYLKYDATSNPNGYSDNNKYSRENTLLKNALKFAESYITDGDVLDGDGDGYVDNVNFIVFGKPAGWSDLLWPHMSSGLGGSLKGKIVSRYNLNMQSSVGYKVLCHEFGHTLGLPDLYRYTDKTITPVGIWSMMSNNNADFMMREKFKLGWISEIPVIESDGTYSLKPITEKNNSVYRINSPRKTSEHFLVEFRRRTGYDASIPGTGMLVYRINTTISGWGGNADGPPDEIYIFRPDGSPTIPGSLNSAFFSYESNRTAIADSGTNPISFLSDGLAGGLDIKNISSSAGSEMTFDVRIVDELKIESEYKITKTNYQWIDIEQTGNKITEWENYTLTDNSKLDDGYSKNAIPIGFDFQFYGQTFNTLYVGINGLVSFTKKELNVKNASQSFGYFGNVAWPGNTNFPNSIALAYNDFDLNPHDTYGGGRIMYKTINDQFILSFINIGTFEAKGDTTNSFQLVLNKNDNSFYLNYKKFGRPKTREDVSIAFQKDNTKGQSYYNNKEPLANKPIDGTSILVEINPGFTSIKNNLELPNNYELFNNYPNPFNPSTNISYYLPEASFVKIKIFDVTGRLVKEIVGNQQNVGKHTVKFDAQGYSSGVYFYVIDAVSLNSSKVFKQSKKMLLLK